MNWKSFVLGATVGLAGGYAIKEIASQKLPISAERVLKDAKIKFQKSGPISGSWIHMEAEEYEKNGISYRIFKGGISKVIDGTTVQYEFIADAHTGTIIEAYPFSR